MSQRVKPWQRWGPATGLVVSQSGTGFSQLVVDNPPTIVSTPSPSFTAGVAGSYSMAQHVSDDGESPLTYALSGILPAWYSFNTSTGLLSYNGLGVLVTTDSTPVFGFDTTGPVYSGVRYASSGIEYQNALPTLTSFTTQRNGWLDFGTVGEVWVEFTNLGPGTLNWHDPGAGRLSMTSARTIGVEQVGNGTNATSVQVDFYDRATGGVLIHTRTQVLSADVGF